MEKNEIPGWLLNLESEEVGFIKNFILASGSLKALAEEYRVTYPTIRLRLDRLIEKIKINEAEVGEPYIALIKRLAIDEKIDFAAAKLLIKEYKKQAGEEG